jgi:hypothetical protein
MRRKINQVHDHADGPQGLGGAVKAISEALSRDAARREHLLPAQSAAKAVPKPARRCPESPQPRATNVVAMPEGDRVRETTNLTTRRTAIEPTAVDVAGSMFVASAELVLSTLEELRVHVETLQTKKEIEHVLASQIERWREAVIQFRAERSRSLPGGK